jgi:Na+-translocating ferredoxin:NAD+ oxidoreductase RnfG subunit
MQEWQFGFKLLNEMKKIGVIAVLVFFISGFTTSKRVEALIEKEIKTVFEIENYTKEPIVVSTDIIEKLPIKLTEDNLFRINKSEGLLGYYYLGQAFGKVDYFDFIVIFDADLMVSKIKILVYREDHGGEIRSKRWLKQFIGTSKDMHVKYQEDIAAISGATISAKAMTNEINKVLKTINILYNNQQL